AAFTWVNSAGEVVLSSATQRLLTPEARTQYFAHYGALDPKVPIFARARPGFLFNDVEHFGRDFIRRDPFYQEFSRPIDSRHTLDMQIAKGFAGDVYLATVRTRRQGVYGPRDVARFCQASRHFREVLRLRRRLAEGERLIEAARGALDALAFGLIVLDGNANVVVANTAAAAVCSGSDGLQLAQNRITASAPAADRALGAIVARVLTGGPGRSLRIARDGSAWWLVSVLPLPANSPFAQKDRPGALVLIADPGAGQSVRRDDLVALYGLTVAEAELALLLARGVQLHAAAAMRGVKPSTVRSQLLSILQKMQISRQADLTRILGSLPLSFLSP
ncbi:MAG: hypothetical protein JO348_02505, partial [Alphaproteobacteria bacterium]|nr:hypothetical protein [Alphaproteobacteria bacterium]